MADTDRFRGFAGIPSFAPVYKYPMKMQLFGLSETKLFHFHGIFKKNEIKLASPSLIHINPLSRDPGLTPGFMPSKLAISAHNC